MLTANPKHLHAWKLGTQRQRFDYETPDHLLSEMTHHEYWSTVMHEIEPGDLIHVTDAATEGAVIKIDWKDTVARTVGTSLIERVSETPVVGASGYTIKWRGPRGGGWCVVDGKGAIVMKELASKEDAQRHMLMLAEQKAA